jgi:hypothetical protein
MDISREYGLILVGAIMFTASFMWKDLLSDIEDTYFPKNLGLAGRIFFTFIVTIILIAIVVKLKYIFGIDISRIRFDDYPIPEEEEEMV